MKQYTSVEDFITEQEILLKLEQEAEVNEKTILYECKSPKELEKHGLCIRNLSIDHHNTSMYGRFLVGFAQKQHLQAGDLKAHQLTSGDIVGVYANKADNSQNNVVAMGTVSQVRGMLTTVAFDKEFPISNSSTYRLMKLTNDVTYRRLKKTLHSLTKVNAQSPCQHIVDSLFPCKTADSDRSGCLTKQVNFFNKSLDDSQRDAVKFVTHTKHLISVIHGPPGTGKTTTVIEAVQQAVKVFSQKVLICAPSNIAVDNLVERLVKIKCNVVRLGHPARALEEVQKYTLDANLLRHDSNEIIKNVRDDLTSMSVKFKKCRSKSDILALRREYKDLRKELDNRETKAIKEVLRNTDVVLATTTSASAEGPLKHLSDDHFDLMFIDESAQALEASCWIPMLRSKRCVLAGDHKQLPPTIVSVQAAKQGLDVTLLERAIDGLGENVVCMLTTQYRMHKTIMKWPSLMLYDDKLCASASVSNHLLHHLQDVRETQDTSVPLIVVDTAGCFCYEMEQEDELSKCNPFEVDIIREHADSLLDAGVHPKDVGVISPYNLQVELLRQNIHPANPGIEISSVDGFQGREKEAILISLVRSNAKGEVGFLSEDRRINVAITRARRHLFLVCDSDTICHHAFLKSFYEYSSVHGEIRAPFQSSMQSAIVADTSKFEMKLDANLELPRDSTTVSRETLPEFVSSLSTNTGDNQKMKKFNTEVSNAKKRRCKKTNLITDIDDGQRERMTQDAAEQTTYDGNTIRKLIAEFALDERQTFSFPETLTAKQRALVHTEAELRSLEHTSEGVSNKRKIMIKKASGKACDSATSLIGSVQCEICLSKVPKGNIELHSLRCKKSDIVKERVVTETKSKKTKKLKKKDSLKINEEEEEDVDLLIESFVVQNSSCNQPKCKQSVKLVGQMCVFCRRMFCLSHHQAEVHGCGKQAKIKAQRDISRFRGCEPPKLNSTKKIQVERKLHGKLSEMEKARKGKSEK